MHPYHRNDALLTFCAQHSIHVTAYAPLGSPDSASIFPRKKPLVLMEDATVKVSRCCGDRQFEVARPVSNMSMSQGEGRLSGAGLHHAGLGTVLPLQGRCVCLPDVLGSGGHSVRQAHQPSTCRTCRTLRRRWRRVPARMWGRCWCAGRCSTAPLSFPSRRRPPASGGCDTCRSSVCGLLCARRTGLEPGCS